MIKFLNLFDRIKYIHILNIILIISLHFYVSLEAKNHDGLHISDITADKLVVNGESYEKILFNNNLITEIMIPYNAETQVNIKNNNIEIYLIKSLAFMGHPPYPMTIKCVKDYMGIAYKIIKNKSIFATYGEWRSTEGGATIKILFIVPKKVKIIKNKNLSGKNSLAYYDEKNSLIDTIERDQRYLKCYWYGHIGPIKNWKMLKTQVDVDLNKYRK